MVVQESVFLVDGVEHKLSIFIERRNSVRISLTKKGINLRVPRHLSKFDRDRSVKKMLSWATKKLKEKASKKVEQITYRDGQHLRTINKVYCLSIEVRDSKKNFAKVKDNKIILKIASHHDASARQEYISKKLKKLLAVDNQAFLQRRVRELNDKHFGLQVKKVSWRYTRSRWGVCKTESKEIELSTKLLLAPIQVLDYVIIHELSHLIQADHSKRFWNIVKSVDLSYKKKIRWLKEHGNTLVI